MEEYEYSFNVKSIEPFLEYCRKNQYKEISITNQNRIVYENKHNKHMIARITTTKSGENQVTEFDCKNVGTEHKSLKISSESLPLIVTEENRKVVESMLDVLDFYMSANNNRTRYVYEKNGVKFEIDDYISPQMKVVAIEGEKQQVDNVYDQLKNLIN